MIPNSFPYTQGPLSKEQYLTLLLLALLDQTGGELRITAKNLEAVDSGGRLLADWDSDHQQLVLRSGSKALVVSEVRGAGWKTLAGEPAATQPPQPEDKTRHRVVTEADMIDWLKQRMQADRMREWREQGAAAVSAMPPPEEPPAQ